MPKRGYGFTFKGIKSDDMGMWMIWMPEIPQPARMGKYENVPGRDGTLWVDDGGYESIKLKVPCITKPGADFGAICKWLSGAGDLIFDMDAGYSRRARITMEYAAKYTQPRSNVREFQVNFECQPFRYQHPAPTLTVTNMQAVLNPGNVTSEPIFIITGSGDINLLVGTTAVLITALSGKIAINSEAMMAYDPDNLSISKNASVYLASSDEWPKLPPGNTYVQWTGNATKVEVKPQWRWM